MRPIETRSTSEANPITAVRQYPWIVVVFALAFGALGGIFALLQPPSFAATARLVVQDPRTTAQLTTRAADAERYVADQVAIIESRVVAERASEIAAGLEPPVRIIPETFLDNINAASSSDSNVITITFGAESAREAQAGANVTGQAYEEVIRAALAQNAETAIGELDVAIDEAVAEVEALQSRIETVRADNDERSELDDQLAEIVAGLVEIRNESAQLEAEDGGFSPEAGQNEAEIRRQQIADLKDRAEQLSAELSARLLVSDVEARLPATASLLRQQEDAVARLTELTLRRNQIEVDSQLAGNGVAFFAPAGLGTSRGIPASSTVVFLSAIGALIGVGVAYVLGQRRQTLENRLAPQEILDAPLLGEVPSLQGGGGILGAAQWFNRLRQTDVPSRGRLPVIEQPASVHAEAFRVLVGALTQRLTATRAAASASTGSVSTRGMIVGMCSAGLKEGKTVVAANVALAAAKAGLRVVLVDGDFGAQDASQLIASKLSSEQMTAGLTERTMTVGLTEVVHEGIPLDDAIAKIRVGATGSFALLGRGGADVTAPDVFASPATATVFQELADSYDLVILDLPPLLQVAYATAALQNTDRALVVVRHRSQKSDLQELRYRLDLVGSTTVGYVYTNAPTRREAALLDTPTGDVLGRASRPGRVDEEVTG